MNETKEGTMFARCSKTRVKVLVSVYNVAAQFTHVAKRRVTFESKAYRLDLVNSE